MSLIVGTVIEMTRDAPYPEYNVVKGDIGIINYVAKSGKYAIHIYGKTNPHRDANGRYGEVGDFWIPFDYVRTYHYKTGDRVEIISPKSKYKGYCGTVYKETHSWPNNCVKLFVDGTDYQKSLDHTKTLNLIITSIRPINTINSKGDNNMKLTGFNKVAVIEHSSGINLHYALYDDDIGVEDNVLVTGKLSDKILVVKDVITLDQAREVFKGDIIAEVKCKVDLSNYNIRVHNRIEAAKLREKMDEEIKKMDELNKYEMYADRNPALKEMLEQLKNLGV